MLKNCSGPQVVTPVVWNKPDVENSVPLWIIILAILAGLLLLALLIFVLYKVSDVRLPVSHNVIFCMACIDAIAPALGCH